MTDHLIIKIMKILLNQDNYLEFNQSIKIKKKSGLLLRITSQLTEDEDVDVDHPCQRDRTGEIIDPFERPIIVSKSTGVDRSDDNDNLLDLIPPPISDSTKQVSRLESWESLDIRTNEGDNEGTAGGDNDKTVLTEDCPDLSDYNNPIQNTLQIIKDQEAQSRQDRSSAIPGVLCYQCE